MKKKTLSILLSIIILIGVFPVYISAEGITSVMPTEGNGSKEEPYLIDTADELAWFAEYVNGSLEDGWAHTDVCAKLTSDIDLNNIEWTPIGNVPSHDSYEFYTGTFDGNNHIISNLKVSASSNRFFGGLFGGLDESAVIKNLGIVNADVTAFGGAGAIAGGTSLYSNTVSITRCFVADSTVNSPGENFNAGGFIGGMWGTDDGFGIKKCFAYNIKISNDTDNRGAFAGYDAVVGNSYCYYDKNFLSPTNNEGEYVSDTVFASGEIAYRLNSGAVKDDYWYQRLEGLNADLYPVFDPTHGKVLFENNEYISVYCTEHDYEISGFTAQNCTEYGFYTLTCNVCGETMTTIDYASKPLGHNWENGGLTASTCTDDGYYTLKCSRCNETKKEINQYDLAVGNHNFDTDGFCTVCDAPEPCVYLTNDNIWGYLGDDFYTDFYAICNAGNLYWFADYVTNNNSVSKGILINDITVNKNVLDENGDLNDGDFREWVPMCAGDVDFKGFFVGGGHSISGLVVKEDSSCNGFFAKFDKGSRIYDTVIKDSYFYGSSYVGGICARNNYGQIEDCEVHATIEGTSSTCGGICGSIESICLFSYTYGRIYNCKFYGKVSSTSSCGGIVGKLGGIFGGEQEKCLAVSGCKNYADVTGQKFAGGIFAFNNNLKVTDCENHGNIYAKYAGGLGGRMSDELSVLERSYNDGKVSGTSAAGIVHTTYPSPKLNNCYNAGVIIADEACSFVSSMNNRLDNLFTIENDLYCFNNNHDFPEYRFKFTAEQFASGEAAYIMNEYAGSNIWHQKIPEMSLPTTDTSLPIVYKYAPEGGEVYYSNTPCSHSYKSSHIDANCIECGKTLYVCSICGNSYTTDISGEPMSGIHNFVNGICSVCGAKDIPSVNDDGVYEIGTFGQLLWFSSFVNGDEFACDYDSVNNPDGIKQNPCANAVLTADISMNGNTEFIPIGNSENGYSGTFDGNSHTLSDFVFEADEKIAASGIFGTVKGEIKNLCIDNAEITSEAEYCGVIAGLICDGAVIENCCAINSKLNIPGGSVSGYISGAAIPGYIKNSYTFGCSSSNESVGGIVGNSATEEYSPLTEGRVINCYTDCEKLVAQKLKIESCEGEASVSESRFSSGEITYKLNGIQENINWYQNTLTDTDELPVLDSSHAIIYRYKGYNTFYNNANFCEHEIMTSKTVEPSCGVKGYTVNKCSDCGIEIINGYTDALEHDYIDGVCKNCGEYELKVLQNSAEADAYGLTKKYIGYAVIDCADAFLQYKNKLNTYKEIKFNAVLTDDITFNESVLDSSYEVIAQNAKSFEPIGTSENGYTSIFDGNSNTISGIYIDSSADNTGFIGYLDGGTVKNLNIEDSYISGGDYTGGICGRMSADDSLIENCTFSGVVNGSEYVGGITGGINRFGDIVNCKSYGKVSGNSSVGGIAGQIYKSTVSGCENNAEVNANNYFSGGIFGFADAGEVLYCVNNGKINGNLTTGGIAGWMYYKNTSVNHSYNTGDVSGTQYTGGIVGGVSGYAVVNDCWSSGNVSAYESFGGLAGNVGSKNMTNCSYNNTVFTGEAFGTLGVVCENCKAYSTDEFNSGKVAYTMNENEGKEICYQCISAENSLPSFDTSLPSVYKYNLGTKGYYCNLADIDEDGDMDENDYTCIVNISLGSSEYSSKQIKSADINGDGLADVLDCSLFERIYTRIETRTFAAND